MDIECLHVLSGFFVVNRRPQLHALFWIGKPGRHNTDNLVGLRIEAYYFVENRRIAPEAPLPQSPTQDDRRIRGWLIVFRSEASPERRFDPQRWK